MANEFVARKGLIVSGSANISGSVTANNFYGTASNAVSSSYALTASYALNGSGGGNTFPYTGNAVITGSLNVTQAVTASYFTGDGSQLTNLRTSVAIESYNFDGDGTTKTYVLSQSYYSAEGLLISVGGVTYAPNIDYTFTSSTKQVNFVEAPATQSNIYIRVPLSVGTGISSSFTGSFVGDGSGLKNVPTTLGVVNHIYTGSGVTQNYALSASYDPTSLIVTVGGLRYINDNDYTVSASTLQFTQAPASQSIILIQALLGLSSGSVGTFSGSFIGTATTASYVLPSGLPSGVISSSAQINTYLDLDGVYSSSAQVLTAISGSVITPSTITASGHIVPSTTDIYDLGSPDKKWRSLYVSGSTIYLGTLQLKDNSGTFAVVNQSGDNLPVSGTFTGSFFGTSSWANNALTASLVDYTNVVNKPTLVSASSQVSYPSLSNIPAGIVSGAAQVAELLPPNTVSSSTQVTAFLPANTVSSSGQVTAFLPIGTVSSSTQVDFATISNKPTLISQSSQVIVQNTTGIGALATTGSNTYIGDQVTSGSLTVTQNFIVLGSSSIQYLSQSTLNVGTNIITVNTNTPGLTLGGLAVIDSGSSPQRSGSLLFDSVSDHWIFVHQNTAGGVTSSVVLMGPPTFNNVGSEILLTQNRLLKSAGLEHVTSSVIYDDNVNVGIGTSSPAAKLDVAGNIFPSSDNLYDLGSTSKRWANLYTGDLNLSNEGSSGNTVDGTTGNWTIQEGEEYLYIINNP
jgi:hypothetical protein